MICGLPVVVVVSLDYDIPDEVHERDLLTGSYMLLHYILTSTDI